MHFSEKVRFYWGQRLLMTRAGSQSKEWLICVAASPHLVFTVADTVRWLLRYMITLMFEAHMKSHTGQWTSPPASCPSSLSLSGGHRRLKPPESFTIKDQWPKKHSMSLCQVPSCLISGPSMESVPSVCLSVCVCVFLFVLFRAGVSVLKVAQKVRCCPCDRVYVVCIGTEMGLVYVCVCVVCDQLSFIAIPLRMPSGHRVCLSVCVWLCQ